MRKLSMTLLLFSVTAMASTTKVGNGDDGTDLEGAIKISSGPIFESRAKALAHLKTLNVQGIPGLGQLIPELEHTELWMTQADVRAMSTEGSWESSEDRNKVYARTFAEPHAPTRFFPAALSLNRDQLIALHTHEALHRALPPEIRENEEKVAILTMAITSPSATFDRVNQFAKSVMGQESYEPVAVASTAGTSSTKLAAEPIVLPAPRRTDVSLKYSNSFTRPGTYSYYTGFEINNVMHTGVGFSPVGVTTFRGRAVEPRLKIEELLLNYGEGFFLGPLTLNGKLPFLSDSGKERIGPLVQFSLKSLEDYPWGVRDGLDRDVYSIGGFYEVDKPSSLNTFTLTYTLPGTGQPKGFFGEAGPASAHKFGSIWSLYGKSGWKGKWFAFLGAYELHHSRGNYESNDPFTIVRAGPELRVMMGRTTFALEAMLKLNRSRGSLDSMADIAGHGTGDNSFSGSLAIDL